MQGITRPTLLLNEKVARKNIQDMADKAKVNQIGLRPHFKTHVSREIGNWFRDAGVDTCTVSSVEMAEYFQHDGWDDITIAFPFNRLEIALINELASKGKINLVIEDSDTLAYLQNHLDSKVNYYIKLDVGTHRTGLGVDTDFSELVVNDRLLNFVGFLAHAGHAYRCRSNKEIINVYKEVSDQLSRLKGKYPTAKISYGDTPTCSIIEKFENIDELRAGNFVFYDWMQKAITSCSFKQIAVCMAVPVVSKHPDRKEIVIHGGAIHFSKDYIKNDSDEAIYGVLVQLTATGWEPMEKTHYVKKLSQEHGIISVTDEKDFNQIKVGDLLGVIPIHSCLAANLMGKYQTVENNVVLHMNWKRE